MIELIISESEEKQPAGELLSSRLGEALFIYLLRSYSELDKQHIGLLAGVHDERISQVLALFHEFPGKEWTLDEVARNIGMSRTSFATRFREVMGETPMNYLSDWRMTLAKEMLKMSDIPVKEIAHKTGYQSEAAFNRVFKDKIRLTPLKYRQSFLTTHT